MVPICADPEDFLARLGKASLPAAVRERVAEPVCIGGPVSSRFRPARWRGQYDAWRLFGGLAKQLQGWERQHDHRIDLVFFACIYDWQFEHFRFSERWFGYPWSGLYLDARSFRLPGSPIPYTGGLPCPEKVFSSPFLKSVAVLDEGVTERMSQVVRGRPVIWFPDIADGKLPAGDDPAWGWANKIRAFAQGRPVVCQVGYLQKSKGVQEFLATACDPRMKHLAFVVAGTPALHGVGREDLAALKRGWEEAPNLWAHLQTVPEEALNALISVSDVVWGAYRDFPNSSNILTKAALLQRPVIVSDAFLMGERVRSYSLGETAQEGNVADLVRCLEKMVEPGYAGRWLSRSRHRDYVTAHSTKALSAAFGTVLNAL